LEKRSLPIALALIARRVARCNPLCKGGFDYPSLPLNAAPKIAALRAPQRRSGKIIWFLAPKGDRYLLIKARNANAGKTNGARLSNKLLSTN
jgi:hypothetical protein